jgi:MEDS: MEthanogen/methylotroph, DcmR Sensory domain
VRRTGTSWTEFLGGAACGHAVQIYGDPAELAESVAAYLASGFEAGEPGILIATAPHRARFEAELAAAGWDAARIDREGLLVIRDAEETLHAIQGSDGSPSASAFEAVVGTLLDGVAVRFPDKHVRAFGEMVDVLCERGEIEAAVSLEELWNSLTRSRRFFSLLCGYQLDVFDLAAQTDVLPGVCRTHSHVLPAADPARLTRAVDLALDEVLGPAEAGKVYSLVGAQIREDRVPAAQLALMWVSEHMPGLAGRILAAARARYLDEPAALSA